jgi:hypothetical protein
MGAMTGQRQPPPHPAEAAPAVVVHAAEQAAAALAAAAGPCGVLLLSAPGAAGSLGAAWFLALVARAAAEVPGRRHWAALDCGDAPGHALAAIRAGVRLLILSPACPAFPGVQAAAAEADATLWPARPSALDLAGLDLRREGGRRRLADWLAGAPGDNPPTLG